MFKVNTNPETGNIVSLHLMGVTFSYAHLINPRPETNFNPGTYGAELVIDDPETITIIKKYLNQVMEEARSEHWGNKIPSNLHLPLRKGKEDSELEKDKFVLKTSSKQQPKLFIRMGDETRAHEVTEDEIDEIYSGMIGEALVTLRAYNYNNIRGIKCYVNAICKTEDGTPLGISISYEDAFSTATEFDSEEAPSKNKKSKKTTEPAEDGEDIDLDKMLSKQSESPTKQQRPTKDKMTTTKKAEPANVTIDDLLK